jgi:hypothetical protein
LLYEKFSVADPDPFFLPIPDPGIKKATDPGSGSATLEKFYQIFEIPPPA